MKKFLALLLVAALLFALTGCFSYGYESTAVTAQEAAASEDAAAPDAQGVPAAGGTSNMGLFTWFQLALAVYLLYCVVTGKGKLFENEYTKCDYKKYKLVMRVLSGLAGVILLANCILELTGVVQEGTVAGWILWGAGFAAIIAVLVYNMAMTDRKAMAEARNNPVVREHPEDPLRAAFVFDDEPEDGASFDESGKNDPQTTDEIKQ